MLCCAVLRYVILEARACMVLLRYSQFRARDRCEKLDRGVIDCGIYLAFFDPVSRHDSRVMDPRPGMKTPALELIMNAEALLQRALRTPSVPIRTESLRTKSQLP